MVRTITLEKQKVRYTLRKSKRAQRMSLTVHCDGAVILTTPFRMPERCAVRFLREKRDWLFKKLSYFRRFGSVRPQRLPRGAYLAHKEAARRLVQERLAHFNAHYRFSYNRITIRDQKTRWGSCSQRGTLSFNYRLALLPPHLADYVVVHELCHLAHFNHSASFWQLVAQMCPAYRACRKELRAVPLR